MSMLDLDKIKAARVHNKPFTYFVCAGAVKNDYLDRFNKDWPASKIPGSVPLQNLDYGPMMQRFIADLEGSELAELFAEKLQIDLAPYPTMVTVRNRCRLKDGQAHTDSDSKIITVLLYMPEQKTWRDADQGGRLRVLRSRDIEDYVAEVPPAWGTMLAFVNGNNAWHGHLPFQGSRRVLQLNWVQNVGVIKHEQQRHNLSFKFKKARAALGFYG